MGDIDYFAEVWKGDPIADKALARIAELESEYDKLADELAVSKRLNGEWMDKSTEAVIRAEKAEAALAGAKVQAARYLNTARQTEAALAERDRMLRLQIEHEYGPVDDDYLVDLVAILRARAEEGRKP